MAAKTIKINTVSAVILIFITGEFSAYFLSKHVSIDPLMMTGVTRLAQILVSVWIIIKFETRLSSIGWSRDSWRAGLIKGAFWSMGFGVIVGLTMMIVTWYGYNPLLFFRGNLRGYSLPLFFVVGGLIAPIFEEICFRGVIYNYMRQIGIGIGSLIFQNYEKSKRSQALVLLSAVIFAVICSTLIFAILHSVRGLPVTQIIGGIVFAIAYETSGNLMVPITIHVTGNLAIFSLSLLST